MSAYVVRPLRWFFSKLDGETNAGFLLNEHVNLYCLLHNNSVHIVLLNLKKKIQKIYRKEIMILVKECDENYDRENDSTNALRPRHFK